MTDTLFQSNISSLPLIGRGKVRENYAVGDDKLLIVTSDRLSAFDVIMSEPIPKKGEVLNRMSNFWFEKLKGIAPNHLTGIDPESVVSERERDQVRNRSVVTKRLKPIMVEAVVRGYLAGSGWKDYRETGAVCGVTLPKGLRNADRLPEPIFTPARKALLGHHDENVDFATVEREIGTKIATRIRDLSLALYSAARDYAATRGILIADTKFEFGLNEAGEIVLMDEVLTADSSRFWPEEGYAPGANPPSFDKQFVRDYLESVPGWMKTAPPPHLPPAIIEKTSAKYCEALERLTR
jgi:phosphoribosylaminoimidazole-succinocarboxamide synthase